MNKTIKDELKENAFGPCVSLIASTEYRTFLDRETLRLKFKNSISEIKKQLEKANYTGDVIKKMIGSLMNLVEQIDFGHLQKGVGIFVSPNYTKVVSFTFPVTDKISINDHFLLSDVERMENTKDNFSVLLLSKKECRLFEGCENIIHEVNDDNFPLLFEKLYEVNRTSTHSFYNNEESKIDKSRIESYFRKVDKQLNEYSEQPIILLGVVENLSLFKSISKRENTVVAEIEGSFDKKTSHEILQSILPFIENIEA